MDRKIGILALNLDVEQFGPQRANQGAVLLEIELLQLPPRLGGVASGGQLAAGPRKLRTRGLHVDLDQLRAKMLRPKFVHREDRLFRGLVLRGGQCAPHHSEIAVQEIKVVGKSDIRLWFQKDTQKVRALQRIAKAKAVSAAETIQSAIEFGDGQRQIVPQLLLDHL